LAAQARGDYATASADYLSVVASQPGNYVAWYDLGVIAGRDGEAAQAAHDYSQAIAANPKYVPGLYNLALSEAAADPTGALGLYRRVVSLQPDNAEALFNEGLLLESTGQTALGIQDVAKAVDLDPSLGPKGS
jgi:tetratricopeptide (TPR) repeat protein